VRRVDGSIPRVRKKLTLDAAALQRDELYAERHSTSLSRVVDDLLMRLPLYDADAQLTPTVRRLRGIARGDAGREDHRTYLLGKYGP
jgi:hypothetical protein